MPARGHVTCPPEWICTLAESLQLVFAGEVEVSINDPFVGGYISQYHYERRGIPWIQMEINRKLYLNEVYFDLEEDLLDEPRPETIASYPQFKRRDAAFQEVGLAPA
jgi:N-formylglutamate amidohydrolase